MSDADSEDGDEEPLPRAQRLQAEARSIQHRMCHIPKNPYCDICRRSRMYRHKVTRKRHDPLEARGELEEVTKFGQRPRNRGYFSRPPRTFCIEKYNISRSGYHSKFHRILHWWGVSCSRRIQPASRMRRNQPASQTATAAESASQPPCCGGISQPAKESTSAQSHLMLVNSDHPCRPFLRGGWRNFACAADGGISHRSAADGGISHRSTAAGGISRSRRTAESATEPRRLAEFRVCGGRRNQPPIRGGWRKSFLRPRCPTCRILRLPRKAQSFQNPLFKETYLI